ncbi:Early light-induced protein [Dorcoceras hygrometricum]|uniref:Early light-induced protein n=1 Tax=Dorcoceras hygrometricum TaxID=472368 RepID=A0A2Z7BLW7_9LAMI|nr:Early light-induced protein [Dorcoceras hygrometricum]KZV34379.1 Early light-induced protein [Dorcoceras hygrometricum]KZV49260.1 Early light-induced protein [Dorcoceras hygrometricum]
MATGMQLISGTGLASRIGGLNRFAPVRSSVPLFKRDLKFRVRSTADQDGGDVVDEKVKAAIPVPPRLFSTPAPPPQPEESTKISTIMAFDGPGPERINGRLAMLGFVAAIAVELTRGQNIFSQIQNGGIMWFIGTTALFSIASLVPLFKGVSADSRSGGVMTSDAELWNGRLAMVGLIALAYTEYIKGGTLV